MQQNNREKCKWAAKTSNSNQQDQEHQNSRAVEDIPSEDTTGFSVVMTTFAILCTNASTFVER
jgi:hypothetical protein